jgi:flavin-dependent dehydrogenase
MMQPIVVIGGGPAGSACACELARRGSSVLLAQRRDCVRRGPAEICKPIAHRLLEWSCGLSLPAGTHSALPAFSSAWGSGEIDGRSFTFWHTGEAWLLDRPAFDAWLLGAAEAAGVIVLRDCEIRGGRWDVDRWVLDAIVDGREQPLTADFVVEATGRSARSALQSDVTRLMADALVCVWVERPEASANGSSTLIESCAAGWWYAARPAAGRQVVALFTDADLVPSADVRVEWLSRALTETMHVRALTTPLALDEPVRVCDARTSIRNVLWRRAWLSIGDAAWALDPLSGAGIERAIRDGIDAATAIARAAKEANFAPLAAHALARARAFTDSLEIQRRYYALESRWPDAPFWRRRVALVARY